jgi:hypothetical protein
MDLRDFANPPQPARPMARWWWPGLDVEKEELLRELDDLQRSGLGGAELQPFLIGSPQNMEKSDPERARRTHRFMQPYHYEMMAAVLDGAEQRGLTIDITQNSAWPTGGTHISLADSHKTLLFGETVLNGPRAYAGPVPKLKPPRVYLFFGKVVPAVFGGLKMLEYLPEDKKLVRVTAGRLLGRAGKFTSWKNKDSALLDPDSLVDLTGSVGADGRLHWQVPPGRWQVFAAYAGSAGAYPLLDARSAPGTSAQVLDHFNQAALRRHLEAFLGRGREAFGRHFGKTLRAFFTDSFELISPMHWSDHFLEEFQRRRGYDLTPYLPLAYVPLRDVGYFTYSNEPTLPDFDLPGGAGARIRYDCERTISDLFVDEFIHTAAAWGEENGLLSRVQGYGMRADPLRMLGGAHIPEGEQLYGGGALSFLKLIGSAGTLYNRPLVTCETLVWANRPYMTTPLKWRVGLDRLFESGINQAIYHGFPYRHPDFPFPGFQPFASPHSPMGILFDTDMSRGNPLLFDAAPAINAYAARAQNVLQRSRTRAAVGIFYQLFDYPNGYIIPEETVRGVLDETDTPAPPQPGFVEALMPSGLPAKGDRVWVKECSDLGADLVANGWYYQFFNEDSLLRAEARGGQACMGEAAFDALVLFKETALPAEAAEKLRALAESGVTVLCVGSRPERDPGFHEQASRDARVQAALAGLPAPAQPNQLAAALRERGAAAQIAYDLPQPGLGFIHKIERGGADEFFFLRSRTRGEQTASFTVKAAGRLPVELDLWTGAAARLAHTPAAEGAVRLNLTFAGYTARMLALLEPAAAAGLPEAAPDLREANLQTVLSLDAFDFTAEARLADGATRAIALAGLRPGDWRGVPELAGLGGPGTYRARFTLAALEPGRRYFLCCERVHDRAAVTLNGQALAPLLVMPWRVELTAALTAGENTLEIEVTPTLRNALVAYAAAGRREYKMYKKQPTMPAGLIGAARICIL